MTDFGGPKRDRDLRAAELALGLLGGLEHAEAKRELLRDPAFRAFHAFWTTKAGQWLEEVPPADEGADLWAAVEAAIGESQGHDGDGAAAGPTHGRPAFAWAMAATGAALLAGTTAIYFYQRDVAARHDNRSLARELATAKGERQVAQITGDASRVLVSALYDPASGTIGLKLDLSSQPSLVPELWIIPADGKPRSLGTFTTASAEMEVDPAIKPFLIDGATLAVTMEPSGGAPHAAPTGRILGMTELRAI